MLLRFVLCLAALLTALPGRSFAQIAGNFTLQEAAAVDRAMEAEMNAERVTGLAVGIVRNGRIVYLKGYGWADEKKRQPVTTKTMFRWASLSKPITAIAALQLAEQNRLDLDADIRKYVPEFPRTDTPITARQLLSHQGGIVHYANGRVIPTARKYSVEHPYEDVVVALDRFKESPLINVPGSKYSYSTYGYVLLSAVVQRAGGAKFADQVQSRIAAPLGMTTLQPDYQWKNIPDRAVGYRLEGDKIVPSSDTDVSWKLGGGGYISTIEDLARFAMGLLNHRMVSRRTEAAMWEPMRTSTGERTAYGLGFSVDAAADGRKRVSHNGSQEKASCRMVIYPGENHGVVIFSNSEHANPGRFSTAVYSALARR